MYILCTGLNGEKGDIGPPGIGYDGVAGEKVFLKKLSD